MGDKSKGAGKNRTFDDLVREGRESEKNLDFHKAIICFRKSLQIHPNHEIAADINLHLGQILLKIEERPEEALQHLKKAENLGLKDDDTYTIMGEALINLGRFEEAERANLNALKINKRSSAAHVGLGNIYYLQGELVKAKNEISIALGINDKNSLAHNSLGAILSKEEKFQEAEIELLRAIQFEEERSGKSIFCNNLGFLYFQMGRYTESLYYLLSAISLQPRKMTHCNLINTIEAMKGKDNVISQCHQFLKKNPHFSEMNYLLATLLDYVDSSGHESGEYYSRIVDMMKSNPEFSEKLKHYGKSSNPVRVDISNPFSQNMFFIKCDDKKRKKMFEMRRLEKEYATSLFVLNSLREQGLKTRIGEPVAFFEHDDGNIYFITKAQGRRNIKELAMAVGFEDESIEDNVIRCLLNLADIQGYVTRELDGSRRFKVEHDGKTYRVKLDSFDYKHDLDMRMFDRFNHNRNSRKLTNLLLDFVHDEATGNEFFIHADLYWANALEGGSIIDYERCCIGDPVVDAAVLLLNPFFRFDKKDAFEAYYNHLIDASERRLNLNDFRRSFNAHTLFYSIGFAGGRFFREDYATAKKHIQKAIEIMESNKLADMKGCFMSYINESLKRK